MSLTTITQSTQDVALLNRMRASIAKETFANPVFGNTGTGQTVEQSGPDAVLYQFVWPSCIDFEVAYAYAIDQGNENPGGDPGVITDADIQSAVQTHWPDKPEMPGPPPEVNNDLPEPPPEADTNLPDQGQT